jgi:hypothetical protein
MLRLALAVGVSTFYSVLKRVLALRQQLTLRVVGASSVGLVALRCQSNRYPAYH